ncbi:hypothetical protein AK88_05675 [Plasmodium fragile]|uniref:Schizont-infected cell agglutination C-terminal domain-containing protein n=1 Tax=Plasmodium fragile TaxID=5857 RepID=A0A0D9QCG6_PLAFR|nr:uncharacterized protein AK88_05675 [Plasmodium fragile]KJP84693.1 hypothetical protein AK88_05675 [Plasmodium fragile]
MIRDRPPASAAGRRGRRHPRVHKRTLIELHLEVLNECAAAEWENVKDDYLQMLVEEFMGDRHGHRSSPASSSNEDSTTHHSTTLDPPTDSDGTDACPLNDPDPWRCMETKELQTDRSPPNDEHRWKCTETIHVATHPCQPHEHDPDPWRCMETIQLATDPCPPNEKDPDPWSCMETIQLDQDPSPPNEQDRLNCMDTLDTEREQRPSTVPGDATSDCTPWINWIDRSKHLLQPCTTQPWFLQLTADWKQYLREHMAADADHGVSGHIDNGEAATLQMKTLRLWKEWIARQHKRTDTYSDEEWFKHLLNTVQEATVSEKGEVLLVEKVMAAEDRVRDVPRSQPLHPQPYMKKPLTAQTWILLLALVVEQCEVERSLQDKELYVDDLLQQL